jgi:hypothetical protein
VDDRHHGHKTGSLSFQVNVICLLLALIGSAAIVRHPAWFGGVPAARETTAPRSN